MGRFRLCRTSRCISAKGSFSEKSEFTPKGIQTKDERANLVYAVKIAVKNDGYLKIGQYGEVIFNRQ